MSSPRDKILELVAGGKIQLDEADQLLAALKPDRSRLDVWILDPFEVIGPGRAWMLAILVCVGSLALARLHVRFDGAVDLHVIGQQVAWTTALADQLVAWPLTALLLWGVTAISNRRARLLEMVAFVGAARLPNLVAGCVAAAVVGDPIRFDPNSNAALLLVATSVPFIGWLFVTLLSAFRAASGSQGRKLAGLFVVGLVVAEIASKIVLRSLS
jgi:hypothetical protein